jgi:hypothetical protein
MKPGLFRYKLFMAFNPEVESGLGGKPLNLEANK